MITKSMPINIKMKQIFNSFFVVLNAEWAAYRSLEFSHKFKRTRKMQLTSILKDYEE